MSFKRKSGWQLLALCLFPVLSLSAQGVEGDGKESKGKGKGKVEKPVSTDEVTITGTRYKQRIFDSPRAITLVGRLELERESPLSLLDTLTGDKPGVWIEKRSMTGSTPVIRGFSGANILALVDGCSLSTMWMTCMARLMQNRSSV